MPATVKPLRNIENLSVLKANSSLLFGDEIYVANATSSRQLLNLCGRMPGQAQQLLFAHSLRDLALHSC